MDAEMQEVLKSIENELKQSKNEWEWKVANLITEIPVGYIISYGTLAKWANKRFGLNIIARQPAELRKKLYKLLRPTKQHLIPLHRLGVTEDLIAEEDSVLTRSEIWEIRNIEGSWIKPKWYNPPE